MTDTRDADFRVCSCIAINHPLHRAGECDEPPVSRGGICRTCRFAAPEVK